MPTLALARCPLWPWDRGPYPVGQPWHSHQLTSHTTTTAGHNADPHVLIPFPLPLHILTHSLTAWSTVPLEKLTDSQLVKEFPAIYGTRRFITAFTSAATCPYPEPHRSSPYRPTHFWRSILILSSHLRLCLPRGLFPQGSTSKRCKHLFPPPYVLHAPPNSFFSIWSPEKYSVRVTDN